MNVKTKFIFLIPHLTLSYICDLTIYMIIFFIFVVQYNNRCIVVTRLDKKVWKKQHPGKMLQIYINLGVLLVLYSYILYIVQCTLNQYSVYIYIYIWTNGWGWMLMHSNTFSICFSFVFGPVKESTIYSTVHHPLSLWYKTYSTQSAHWYKCTLGWSDFWNKYVKLCQIVTLKLIFWNYFWGRKY